MPNVPSYRSRPKISVFLLMKERNIKYMQHFFCSNLNLRGVKGTGVRYSDDLNTNQLLDYCDKTSSVTKVIEMILFEMSRL